MYYTLDKNNKVIEAFECSGAPLDGYGITDKPVKYGDIYNATTDSFAADPVDIAKDRIAEIDTQLLEIDMKLIRSLAEISAGIDSTGKAAENRDKYIALKTPLQNERATLFTQLKY